MTQGSEIDAYSNIEGGRDRFKVKMACGHTGGIALCQWTETGGQILDGSHVTVTD